jgi:hypothetical protein
VPVGFSVAASFGATSLDPGETTTFAIWMSASTPGECSGDLSFNNNDADEAVFDFWMVGNVVDPQQAEIVDDGDAGFSYSGGWVYWGRSGHDGDVYYSAAGTGTNVAAWTFDVTPGQYRVAATWLPHSNRATDAPYQIYDGAAAPANLASAIDVNQELTPNDFTDAGSAWEQIDTVTVTGNTLTVTLSNAANQYVIADAIRIERLPSGIAAAAAEPGVLIASPIMSTRAAAPGMGTGMVLTAAADNGSGAVWSSRANTVPALETRQRIFSEPDTDWLNANAVRDGEQSAARAMKGTRTAEATVDTWFAELGSAARARTELGDACDELAGVGIE